MKDISYQIIRAARKTISLQITPSGELIVRCPKRMAKAEVERFVRSKQSWIEKKLNQIAARPQLPPFTREQVESLAKQAKQILPGRVAHFASIMGVRYGRITIRSQHSRWGSCSAQGNLNFNCLLLLAPPEVLDYVVVHELCHRKEMNHSERFWAEVAKYCPDYKIHKKWLKDKGSSLIARLPSKEDL